MTPIFKQKDIVRQLETQAKEFKSVDAWYRKAVDGVTPD